MRRIYESRALHRDEDDPFTPTDDDENERSRSTFDYERVSHAFMPMRLRQWAIDVSLETNRDIYDPDDSVLLRIQMENKLPFPVSLKTESPVLWSWDVDGIEEASRVQERNPPDRSALLTFGRSDRKVFHRTWSLSIHETERDWKAVGPGEYTLSAWINVAAPERAGLVAETTVTVR